MSVQVLSHPGPGNLKSHTLFHMSAHVMRVNDSLNRQLLLGPKYLGLYTINR